LAAFIKVPIVISPRYVLLVNNSGKSMTEIVEIRAQLERTLELKPDSFSLAQQVAYSIEEVEKGRKFRVHFKTKPGPAQTYRGFLKIKTNYPEKPEIIIKISGRIKEAG